MSAVPRKTVDLVRQRDTGCVRCGVWGGNVHHRQMRSQAPKDAVHVVENLLLLCGSGTTGCHGWVHAHPAESYRKGWLVRSWQSPPDVPVAYPGGGFFYLTERGTRIKEGTQ